MAVTINWHMPKLGFLALFTTAHAGNQLCFSSYFYEEYPILDNRQKKDSV